MAIEGKDFARLDNLDELINSIDMGLDIEFNLFECRYNISTDGTPYIAVCPAGEGDYYQDGTDMVNNHVIAGKPLKDSWNDIRIINM